MCRRKGEIFNQYLANARYLVSVHVIRFLLLEKCLGVLDDEAILARIQNEHTIIRSCLHETLDPGTKTILTSLTKQG